VNRVIYKYPLQGPRTKLITAENPRVLCVQVQDNRPVVWVEQDTPHRLTDAFSEDATSRTQRTLTFRAYATGQEFPDFPKIFVGTVQLNGFVWHVYQATNE